MLANKYNLFHISAGNLLREEINNNGIYKSTIESYLLKGNIVPVEITCNLIKNKIYNNKINYSKFIIDGFPRNKDNLTGYYSILDNCVNLKGTIVVESDKNKLLERITLRNRSDDNNEVFNNRIKGYNDYTVPIIEELKNKSLVINVNSNKNKEDVFKIIDKKFKYLL